MNMNRKCIWVSWKALIMQMNDKELLSAYLIVESNWCLSRLFISRYSIVSYLSHIHTLTITVDSLEFVYATANFLFKLLKREREGRENEWLLLLNCVGLKKKEMEKWRIMSLSICIVPLMVKSLLYVVLRIIIFQTRHFNHFTIKRKFSQMNK